MEKLNCIPVQTTTAQTQTVYVYRLPTLEEPKTALYHHLNPHSTPRGFDLDFFTLTGGAGTADDEATAFFFDFFGAGATLCTSSSELSDEGPSSSSSSAEELSELSEDASTIAGFATGTCEETV